MCNLKINYVFLFLFVYFVSQVCGKNEGEACLADGVSGVCRNLTQCQYADKLIRVDHKKPSHCTWNYRADLEVVCCPLKEISHRLGQFRNAFGDTADGILRSDKMECRYDGTLPVTCCEVKTTYIPEPEPAGCPKLKPPKRNIDHIAWTKCVEYQRYAYVCQQDEDDPKKYTRREACVMSNLANKISGGVPALTKEFPHMALLGCRNEVDFEGLVKWIAGGTLISEMFVLTAAHAVSHAQYGPVRYVLLGTNMKSMARDGLLRNVVRYKIPEERTSTDKYYDIALLELDTRVIFNDYIRPACLALPEMDLDPEERIIAGWGQTGAAENESDLLLKVSVTEYDASVCSKLVDPAGLPKKWDPKALICAGSEIRQLHDSCRGDSGGPLMAYMKDLECSYAVRGIVSWGPQCGQGAPGVYTNVENYIQWITDIVWP